MSNCIKAMPLEKGFVMPSEWGYMKPLGLAGLSMMTCGLDI